MKRRSYVVDTSAYLIQMRQRGGLKPSPYIMQKYQENERLRRASQEPTPEINAGEALTIRERHKNLPISFSPDIHVPEFF